MNTLKDITEFLNKKVPLEYQEPYDNSGLIVGDRLQQVEKVLVCIDITMKVLEEARENNCNLIVSHHPLIFSPKKNIIKGNLVDDCLFFAIKNDIAIYSMHTNLDNIKQGVSFELAKVLDLKEPNILKPKAAFNMEIGSGVIGMTNSTSSSEYIDFIKSRFPTSQIKHTALLEKSINKVAVCGGSGAFLINEAKQQNADIYITGDLKYHDYFLSEEKIILVDIGHYESEEITKNLIFDILSNKFSNIAVLLCKTNTNPVYIASN